MTDTIAQRLAAKGIELPVGPRPVANYVPAILSGNLLFVSGQVPFVDGKIAVAGQLGAGVTVAEGQRAAEICAINILAQAKAALGDLERIEQALRLTGFVASVPDFTDQPAVVNGASNLLAEILGERGRHTRSAVGVVSLPLGAAVEIDAIFAVKAS
ncbi:MAG: RidA family protein [Rhizobiales bacterium]|nr:RidA family protein [Hyphomicrobiales bacterium]